VLKEHVALQWYTWDDIIYFLIRDTSHANSTLISKVTYMSDNCKRKLLFLPKAKKILNIWNISLVHEIINDAELGARMLYATLAR
jgi:phage pi2 protein 07